MKLIEVFSLDFSRSSMVHVVRNVGRSVLFHVTWKNIPENVFYHTYMVYCSCNVELISHDVLLHGCIFPTISPLAMPTFGIRQHYHGAGHHITPNGSGRLDCCYADRQQHLFQRISQAYQKLIFENGNG